MIHSNHRSYAFIYRILISLFFERHRYCLTFFIFYSYKQLFKYLDYCIFAASFTNISSPLSVKG